MPNTKNKDIVKDLREKLNSAKAIYFAFHQGLTASEMNKLRAKMAEAKGEVVVSKNTLLKVALREEGFDQDLSETLQGPVATFISYDDVLSPIKIVTEFAKGKEVPQFKAGFIEKVFTLKDKIEELATIPSKEVLIARMVRGFKSPLTSIVNVLGANQRNFVNVLSQISKNKQ